MSIGLNCPEGLHADNNDDLIPIGVGWGSCCSEVVREAQAFGDHELAAYITDWPLPDELGPVHSQIIARIDQKIIKPDDFLMTPSDVEPQVISNHHIVFQIRFPIGSEHDTDVF